MLQLVGLVVCGILLWRMVLQNKKKKDPNTVYPPGPGLLETIYQLGILRHNVQKVACGWALKYGELFRLRFFGVNATFVNSLKAGKVIFGQHSGAGRYKSPNLALISGGAGFGIVNTDGKPWAEARKAALASLGRYGFGRKEGEAIILQEADTLCDWFANEMKNSPDGIELNNVLVPVKNCVSSTIWQMIGSKRLTPESQEIYDLMNHFLHAVQKSSLRGLLFFPWLRHILPKWTCYEDCKNGSEACHKYIAEEFDKHRETYEEGKMRDLMDSYIKLINETTDPNSVFYGELGRRNAVASMVDILAATWDSVSESICFALGYFATHPEVQKKLHEEIDRVVGRTQPPTGEHKKNMPYMEAAIEESFRMGTIAPWGMPHEALEDFTYGDYKVNKGEILIFNTYYVHNDKKIWGDPENFRPERFFEGERGKELRKYIVPFMPGRRTCPGQPLTLDTVYFFLTRVLQKFEVYPDPNTPKERYMETDMLLGQFPVNVKLSYKLRT